MNKTLAISFIALSAVTSALAQSTFTSESSFLAALGSGYYLNNFSSLSPLNGSPYTTESFSGGSPIVNYTITAPPGGLFVNQDAGGLNAIGNWSASDSVLFSFTSGNVYAVGAEFYLNDISGNPQAGNTTVTFNNGTTAQVASSSSATQGPYGFFGFISSTPITSMSVLDGATGHFVNIANLYVSGVTPVPEPATSALLVLGATSLALYRRRN